MDIKARNITLNSSSIEGLANSLSAESRNIKLVMILCPLFKMGELEESELLFGTSCSIANSRICSKWKSTLNLLDTMRVKFQEGRDSIHVDFIFADNGTPNPTMTIKDFEDIQKHEDVWRSELNERFANTNISFTLHKFSDFCPEVPAFIDLKNVDNEVENIKTSENFILEVNKLLARWISLNPPQIGINRKNKKIVKRLISFFNTSTAINMCATYIAKRFRLPEIFPDSIFVWIERSDVLLVIDDMLEEFKNAKKVLIKV